MNDFLNSRIKKLPPSGIRKFFDLVLQTKDVISLGVGEPGVPTPWEIREAAIFALEKNLTSYTENAGLFALREEISRFMYSKYKLKYSPEDEILVTTAVSEAVDISLRVILEPDDEFLVPSPSYVMYSPLGEMALGKPIFYSAREKEISKEIEKAITSKTKILILNYPNNPLGKTIEKNDLIKISKIVEKNNLIVISDEIYSELTFDGKTHISFASIGKMKSRTITVNGFSKYFAMTGFRLGYACSDKTLIQGLKKIHQYCMLCAPTISQFAAIEALKNHKKIIPKIRKTFESQRNYAISKLEEIGFEEIDCEGAFYLFLNIKKFSLSSEEFCLSLLKKEKVAAVPGTAFGDSGEGFIRINFAVEEKVLKEALIRIKKFISSLKVQ